MYAMPNKVLRWDSKRASLFFWLDPGGVNDFLENSRLFRPKICNFLGLRNQRRWINFIDLQNVELIQIFVHFFVGGDLAEPGVIFFQWCRFSPIHGRIGLELVQLITLINLNKFLTNTISSKPLKTFSRTKFRWFVVRICSFLVFRQFYKQFYLI